MLETDRFLIACPTENYYSLPSRLLRAGKHGENKTADNLSDPSPWEKEGNKSKKKLQLQSVLVFVTTRWNRICQHGKIHNEARQQL